MARNNYGSYTPDPTIMDVLIDNWGKGALGITASLWLLTCLNALGKNEARVITGMFGKPKGVLNNPGLNLTLPWPLTRTYAAVSTKNQIMHDDLFTKTKNNVTLTIPIDTEFRIVDAEKYAYATDDPLGILKQKISRAVKGVINDLEYAEVTSKKDQIPDQVKKELDKELLETYGIELIDVMVDEPKPEQKIEDALNRREAAKLAEEAAEREGNAESTRIVEMAKGIAAGAKEIDAQAREAGFPSGLSLVLLAQRHIAVTDASKGAGNIVIDTATPDAGAYAAGLATGRAETPEPPQPSA